MANVSFSEEPQYARREAVADGKQGSIIGLMYKLGIASTQKDANVVMGGIIVVCILVSATMFVLVQPHPRAIDQAQLQRDLARMHAGTNTTLPTNH